MSETFLEFIPQIENRFDELNDDDKRRFLVFVLLYLGFRELNIQEQDKCDIDFEVDAIILSCIYPKVDFIKMSEIYSKNEKSRLDFLKRMYNNINEITENTQKII